MVECSVIGEWNERQARILELFLDVEDVSVMYLKVRGLMMHQKSGSVRVHMSIGTRHDSLFRQSGAQ